MLVSELETLCRDADIVPGQEPLDSLVDSAFDAALPNGLVEDFDAVPQSVASMEPLDDRAIRDAFLRFFCATLRGYERFLVVPDADFLISGNEWFDTQAFLSSAPKENSAYLNSFVSTQLFQSFIQRRTEDSDVHCLLFDECLTEYHSATVPYGRLGGDVETVVSNDNSQPHMLYSLLVDQSAAAPYGGLPAGNTPQDHLNLTGDRSSADDGSRFAGDSDFDTSSFGLGKPSMSATTDISDSKTGNKLTLDGSDLTSINNSESALTATTAAGDIITAPSRTDLPEGLQFIYCVDGNPCFPHQLDPRLFLPREPDSWLIELSKTAPNPALARSEREVEEANRRRRSATSSRGFHTQKRCLWQLPKLMVRSK
jgi:dDENN domain